MKGTGRDDDAAYPSLDGYLSSTSGSGFTDLVQPLEPLAGPASLPFITGGGQVGAARWSHTDPSYQSSIYALIW